MRTSAASAPLMPSAKSPSSGVDSTSTPRSSSPGPTTGETARITTRCPTVTSETSRDHARPAVTSGSDFVTAISANRIVAPPSVRS